MTDREQGSSGQFTMDLRAEVLACLAAPGRPASSEVLTQEQQRVVFAPPDMTGVVVAGAGSGKTTVMAARMVALAATGMPVESLLGLTFTRKAAAELSTRVDLVLRRAQQRGLVPRDGADPEISTYHSFAQRLVRDSGLFAGIDPGLRVETDFALLPMAVNVASRSRHLATEHQMDLKKVVEQMRRLDAECAEHAVEPGEIRRREQRRLAELEQLAKRTKPVEDLITAATDRIVLSQVVDEYREAKRQAGVMDFGDMMRLAFNAAGHPQVRSRMREQYRAVLLDEYQDTSVVQRQLLQRLFDDNHPVIAVGDPKQSIYGFRGAAVTNIESFSEHFPHDGRPAPVFTLSANFRSAEPIVDLANRSRAVHVATERTQTDSRLSVGREELTGRVRIANFRTGEEESRTVIDGVREEIASGVAAKDILVLVRSNIEADAYTAALQRAGVPAVSSDALAVFDLPEIRDLLAVLAAVADPTANGDVVRLLSGPRWRIGMRDLAVLGRRARGSRPDNPGDLDSVVAQIAQTSDPSADPSLVDTLASLVSSERGLDERFSTAAGERLRAFAEEFELFNSHTGEPLTDQLARILRETGADTEMLLGAQVEQRIAAVNALFSAAAAYESAYPDGGVGGFLRAIEIARAYDLDPQFDPLVNDESVRVLTVHKAKGLEAESVFLPGFFDGAYDDAKLKDHWTVAPGRVPDDLRGDRHAPDLTAAEVMCVAGQVLVPLSNKGVEHLKEHERTLIRQENDRLVYVALTRACQRLMVSSHTWAQGKVKPRRPSVHLEQLRGLPYVDEITWHQPADGEGNPTGAEAEEVPYPQFDAAATARRQRQAQRVLAYLDSRQISAGSAPPGPAQGVETEAQRQMLGHPTADSGTQPSQSELTDDERLRITRWDRDIAALSREKLHASRSDLSVRLPGTLSVTGLQHLLADPEQYARNRRRPMPRRPSRAADTGTRFHDWVATRWGYQPPLVAEADYAADAQIDQPDSVLQGLISAFETSEFAERQPFGVELPFTVTVRGQSVAGRIDAVFDDGPAEDPNLATTSGPAVAVSAPASMTGSAVNPTDAADGTGSTEWMASHRWLIVDWKTGAHSTADEQQLAVYRLAWSELHGVPIDQIEAAFFYVSRNELVYHRDLLDEDELARALGQIVDA